MGLSIIVHKDWQNVVGFHILSAMAKLQSYHLAWLSAHSHRTKQWLRERLRDGFDVHHLDGNHGNDDPANLVLIEHTDHWMMHTDRRVIGRLARTRPELGISPAKVKKRPKAHKPAEVAEAPVVTLPHSNIALPPELEAAWYGPKSAKTIRRTATTATREQLESH